MSTHETGHKINVANFETLTIDVTSFGPTYNPANPLLQIPNLNNKLSDSQTQLTQVNQVLATYRLAVDDRELIFMPFSTLCTKIINAVQASSVTDEYIADIKSVIRKLQGKRVTPVKKDNPATPVNESLKTHSSSQLSYEQRIQNLDLLIDLLQANPNYAPNELEIQLPSIIDLRVHMINSGTSVKNAYSVYVNAIHARNVVLYDKTNGLVKIAQDVKKYVKSVYGGNSPQYHHVANLTFNNPVK